MVGTGTTSLLFHAIVLVFVNRRVGMIIPPIEPVIFKRRNAVQTLSLRRAGGRTALEVPLAGGSGVDQRPLLSVTAGVGLKKEFGIAAIDAAYENAKRFS